MKTISTTLSSNGSKTLLIQRPRLLGPINVKSGPNRNKCPKPNRDTTAGELLDSTSSTFDNNYYKQLVAGKGVFGSDQALFSDYRTRWIVESFAKDQSVFFKEFAASMVNLGNVGVIEDGEVRLNCRVVN